MRLCGMAGCPCSFMQSYTIHVSVALCVTRHVCAGDLLPLELCQGFTLELAPPAKPVSSAAAAAAGCEAAPELAGRSTPGNASSPTAEAPVLNRGTPGLAREPSDPGGSLYPAGAPSLLGEFYVAAQGRAAAIVGATRRYGLTPEMSLAECGREVDPDDSEAAAAASKLQAEAAMLWPTAADWQVGVGYSQACVLCSAKSFMFCTLCLLTQVLTCSHSQNKVAAHQQSHRRPQARPPPLLKHKLGWGQAPATSE